MRSVKKDILAAITFLVTGLVFVVAQMEGPKDPLLSQEGECVVSESILVDDVIIQAPIREPVSRDS